jgi:hypothetical protein
MRRSNNPLGRTPLLPADRLLNRSVRMREHEFRTISEIAKLEGISDAEWMRRSLRLCMDVAKRKEVLP